jgi:hypothetical protein
MPLSAALLAAFLAVSAPSVPVSGPTSDPGPTAAEQLRTGIAGGAALAEQLAVSMDRSGLNRAVMVDAPALQEIRSRGAVPLMAAGGALFFAGLLIGDDLGTLLSVGGAVVGAYGVYLYF